MRRQDGNIPKGEGSLILRASLTKLSQVPGVVSIEGLSASEPAMKVTYANGVVVTLMKTILDKDRFDMWYPGKCPGDGPEFVPILEIAEVLERLNGLAEEALKSKPEA